MKSKHHVRIDLTAARRDASELGEIREILFRDDCFEGAESAGIDEVLDRCGIADTLRTLRYAIVPNVAVFCRSVAAAMAFKALEMNQEQIDAEWHGVMTRILAQASHADNDWLRKQWSLLKSAINGEGDETGNFYPIKDHVTELVCEVIASLGFETLEDLDECALYAPEDALNNWIELSTNCNQSMMALQTICLAAQDSERKWQKGTGLKFEFVNETIAREYQKALQDIRGMESDGIDHLATDVLMAMSMQG